MGPSVQPNPQRSLSTELALLSSKNRSLLMIAILAGMAAAAAFVLFHALRTTLSEPVTATASSGRPAFHKPSVFGASVPIANPPAIQSSPTQLMKEGNLAVVTVIARDRNDQSMGQGTGYVYSANGFIVTTYSTIRGASSVKVHTSTGDELNVIAIMGYNASRDLAVLAVLEGNLPPLENGAAEVVGEGDPVMAIGPDNAVAKGVVGARRAIGGVDLIPVSAEATPGSPLQNAQGKVIGIVTQRQMGGQTLTFAIPSRYVSDLLAEHRVLSFAQMLEETKSAR